MKIERCTINGISVTYFYNGDTLPNKNVVYEIIGRKSGKFYYGSTSDLRRRMREHCNGFEQRVDEFINREKDITVKVLGSYDTREDAYYVEKKVIRGMCDIIYEKSRKDGSVPEVVGRSMLNEKLYIS